MANQNTNAAGVAPWEVDWPATTPPIPEGFVRERPTASAIAKKPWEKDWSAPAQSALPPIPEGFTLEGAPAASPGLTLTPVDHDPFAAKPELSMGAKALDVLKSAGVGIGEGVLGLAGLPGDVGRLIGKGGDWLAEKLGEDPAKIAADRAKVDGSRLDLLPTTDSLTKGVEGVTGKFYEPQSGYGGVARAVGSFAPAALLGPGGTAGKLARFAVAPGLASEGAGKLTEGTSAEPYARAAAALIAPMMGPRMLTPIRTTAEHAAAVNALQNEGVTSLTAGQITGSNTLKHMEGLFGNSPFSGGRAAAIDARGSDQFTGAALRRAGITGETHATPEVVDNAFNRIGGDFDRLSASNQLQHDGRLSHELFDAQRNYYSLTNPSQRAPIVDDTLREIGDAIVNNGGSLPGEFYQAQRSRLSAAARGSNDQHLSHTLSDITEALDDAMARSIARNNPADTGGFEQARRQYRNMLVIERAAAAAGENAAKGVITPAMLASSAKAIMGKRAWVRGQGDFEPLARAGQAALLPLPNSSAAQQASLFHRIQFGGVLGLAGGEAGGLSGAIAGGLLGLAGPAMAGRMLMSRPAQAYLRNQLATGAASTSPALPQGLLTAHQATEE